MPMCPAASLRRNEKSAEMMGATGIQERNKGHSVDQALDEQFATGRLYACISSRPGQCGRCDGYILEV